VADVSRFRWGAALRRARERVLVVLAAGDVAQNVTLENQGRKLPWCLHLGSGFDRPAAYQPPEELEDSHVILTFYSPAAFYARQPDQCWRLQEVVPCQSGEPPPPLPAGGGAAERSRGAGLVALPVQIREADLAPLSRHLKEQAEKAVRDAVIVAGGTTYRARTLEVRRRRSSHGTPP
jgi:hypothetical protein